MRDLSARTRKILLELLPDSKCKSSSQSHNYEHFYYGDRWWMVRIYFADGSWKCDYFPGRHGSDDPTYVCWDGSEVYTDMHRKECLEVKADGTIRQL